MVRQKKQIIGGDAVEKLYASAPEALSGGRLTALEAMSCLEADDPSFWSYGHSSIFGYLCDGVFFDLGFRDARPDGKEGGDVEDSAFVCRLAYDLGSPD